MGQPLRGSIVGFGLALALAGCGAASRPSAGASAAAQVSVIRGWAQALARGDIAAADGYFATPSRVQIAPGEPLVVVHSPSEVRTVNLMLPCGARLLDTSTKAGYIDALFLLTTRPGADCGSGLGATARVAFIIRAGKIAVWRRIASEPGDDARGTPGRPAPTAPVPLPPAARSV